MREGLKERMESNEGFILAGTLWSGHYRTSHLPDTISLCLHEIDHAEKVPPDKGGDRRLLQESGGPAYAETTRKLETRGCTNVRAM